MSLVEKALQKAQAELGRAPKLDPVVGVAPAPISHPTASAPAPRQSEFQVNTLPFVPTLPTLRIDIEAVRKAGLIAPVVQERVIARQLRIVKQAVLRRMQHGAGESPEGESTIPNTIMLTSALPGDGKTFTSFNFAMSLALEKDYKVVLVDADVAKPHISQVLGTASQRGLLEVLGDPTSDIASVVRPTTVRGLYFVPAGQITDTATELLSSGRMDTILRRLATLEPNLIVVFDSPPVLLTSEAQALAAHMSQVLVVVRSNVTPRAAVKQTLDLLAVGQGRAALLLNDAQGSGPADYGYAYGSAQKASTESRGDNNA